MGPLDQVEGKVGLGAIFADHRSRNWIDVSVPAASAGKPTASASQRVTRFSRRTAPGLADAKPEYLFDVAASISARALWNRPPPGI